MDQDENNSDGKLDGSQDMVIETDFEDAVEEMCAPPGIGQGYSSRPYYQYGNEAYYRDEDDEV